ncbi:Fc.00g033200.m01.CDS01 [Cosmosporella sp. VM-42]
MRFLPLLSALFSVVTAIVLPNPIGPYPVAMRVHSLTDSSRIDPYANNTSQHRRVLLSIFWPVDGTKSCSSETVSYMPPATAGVYGQLAGSIGLSNETFGAFELEFCRVGGIKGCKANAKNSRYPLVLFSPGGGNSRLLYSAIARSVASQGYVVVAVDHPYDADIVEFPDGTIITEADIPETDPALEMAAKVRSKDLSFVISQFQKPTSREAMIEGLPGTIDLDKIIAIGHSLGGASSAQAMLSDSRVLGGADLDGRFFNPVMSQGLDRPFMLLGRPKHRTEDTTWIQFWKHLRGPKIEMEVAGTLHGSFTDLPLLVGALDLPKEYQSAVESFVGTVDGVRMQQILAKTLSGFFTLILQGKSKPLLETVQHSAELSIVGSDLS